MLANGWISRPNVTSCKWGIPVEVNRTCAITALFLELEQERLSVRGTQFHHNLPTMTRSFTITYSPPNAAASPPNVLLIVLFVLDHLDQPDSNWHLKRDQGTGCCAREFCCSRLEGLCHGPSRVLYPGSCWRLGCSVMGGANTSVARACPKFRWVPPPGKLRCDFVSKLGQQNFGRLLPWCHFVVFFFQPVF